jgi:hypothetical protein
MPLNHPAKQWLTLRTSSSEPPLANIHALAEYDITFFYTFSWNHMLETVTYATDVAAFIKWLTGKDSSFQSALFSQQE